MVKVEFQTADMPVSSECLWVELVGVDENGLVTGYLRNEPAMILGRWGQLVSFRADQVLPGSWKR